MEIKIKLPGGGMLEFKREPMDWDRFFAICLLIGIYSAEILWNDGGSVDMASRTSRAAYHSKGGVVMNITQKEIDTLARGLKILYNNLADKYGAYDHWAKPIWNGPAPVEEEEVQDERQ